MSSIPKRNLEGTGLPFWRWLLIALFLFSVSGCGLENGVFQVSPSAPPTPYLTSTTPPMPDLVVVSVELVSETEAVCPPPGQAYQVKVVVANKGNAPAGPFVTRLEVDEQLVGSGLQPGEKVEVFFPYSDPKSRGMVDATGLVIESNENNNQISALLDLPTPAPECIATATPQIKTASAKTVLEGHSASVLAVEFSPDGKTLASASVDNTIRLWNVGRERLARTMQGHPFPVNRLKFSPNGATLVTGSTDIRLWQVTTGQLIRTLTGFSGTTTGLDISRDGRWLASSAEDNTVRIWLLSSGAALQIIDEGMTGVTGVVFNPDSNALAWGEVDGTIRIRTTSGKWLFTLKGGFLPVRCLTYSPDGRYLVSGSEDGIIRVWSTADGKQLQSLRGHSKPVNALSFSPDGKWLVSGSQSGRLNLWRFEEGKFNLLPVVIYEGHSASVTSVDFSPEGNLIASGSADGTVRLWEAPE